MPGALAAIGAGATVPGRDAAADQARLGIPDAKHVIVVMVDGLGHHQLEARRGHAPFLRSIEQGTVTAGFPTTTATSLSLFGTGQPAGRTGMTGYTARNPRTGGLANLISWEGAFEPEEWQREPSLLEQADLEGFNVTTLGKRTFAGSGLTHAALRGGQFVGADRLADRIDVALGVARHPGVSYCYWGEIDAAGHKHGWQSDHWVAALEDADRELRRMSRHLPDGAIMVVTADHGMIDIRGERRWNVPDVPALARGVELIAGEPRALHVFVGDDDAEAVAGRWREELGDHAAVFTRDEAIRAGLLGEVADHVRDRLGDLIVAMAGKATVVDSRTQSPQSMGLVGVHGSLTPEELYVPLLVDDGS